MKNAARFSKEKITLMEQSGGSPLCFSSMDFCDLWEVGFEV